jgi:hypothetical protein
MAAKSPSGGRSRPTPAERRTRETVVGTTTAREHYLREKARRSHEAHPDSELMEAAKREYRALLEQEAARGKGGRPKKKPNRPGADTADTNEETETEADNE